MRNETSEPAPYDTALVPTGGADRPHSHEPSGYEPPGWRLIPLDCEITAYAPDDQPLF